jgi:hypothetical protein
MLLHAFVIVHGFTDLIFNAVLRCLLNACVRIIFNPVLRSCLLNACVHREMKLLLRLLRGRFS